MKKLILIVTLFFSPLAVSAGPGDVNWERIEQRYGSTKEQNQSRPPSIDSPSGAERLARKLSRGFNCSHGIWQCRIKPRKNGAKVQLQYDW